MAIQAKFTTIQGVELDTAYINFAPSPQVSKKITNGVKTYSFGGNATVYANKAFYDANDANKNHPIEGFSVTCAADLTNPIFDQLYAALKTNTRLTNVEDLK